MPESDVVSDPSPIISATRSSVVTIYGPAGAGKSQVAKAVAAALGEEVAARVPTDYFLVPRSEGMALAEYHGRSLGWDWALLAARLALPLGTATSTPDVDFEAFVRRAPTGGLAFTVRPVMIVDAMAPFPGANLRVLLEAPDDVRRARIVDRDRRWGTTVSDRWEHLQATWAAARDGVAPDLVLDATRPIADTAARIAEVVRRRG